MATKKKAAAAATAATTMDAAATLTAPPTAPPAKAPKKKAAATTTTDATAATPETPPTKAPKKAAKKAAPKPAEKTHPQLTGKRIAFFGNFLVWPAYHHAHKETVAKRYGATVVEELDESVDVVVFGEGQGAKADQKKKAEKMVAAGSSLLVLDEAGYRELVRLDLTGKHFAFAGGFDISPSEDTDGMLKKMVEAAGGIVDAEVTDALDYFVVGARKGDKKIARVNLAKKLTAAGATFTTFDEREFLQLVRKEKAPTDGSLDFGSFIGHLTTTVDEGKLGRALKMLKGESFKLFTKHDETRLVGVVKSQTGSSDVYAPWITSAGKYGCCNQNLDECMGLGGVCKHLLVVVVGLVRTDNLKPDQALTWLKAARSKGSTMDRDGCAATFVEYKGAEAGTIDWRPTETLPEDFMAL